MIVSTIADGRDPSPSPAHLAPGSDPKEDGYGNTAPHEYECFVEPESRVGVALVNPSVSPSKRSGYRDGGAAGARYRLP